MRSLMFLLLAVLAVIGPVRYLTVAADARESRRVGIEKVREEAAGVRRLIRESAPPALPQVAAHRATLDALDARVDAVGARFGVPESAAPTLEHLETLGQNVGLDTAIQAALLGGIGTGVHAPLRRRAVASILHAVSDAGGATIESVDVAAAPTTRAEAPPLTLLHVGLTALGDPTKLIALSERLVRGGESDPPGDLVEARLEKTSSADWERSVGQSPVPPVRLTLRVELLLGGD